MKVPNQAAFARGVKAVELALIYLEDGARSTAELKLVEALQDLAPKSKILAETLRTNQPLREGWAAAKL